MVPTAVVNGNAEPGGKLRRRRSAGSTPSSRAIASTARSTNAAASGLPAPRYGPVGVVFVTTGVTPKSIFGIAYTPDDIMRVTIGMNIPRIGYAPTSA